MADIGRIVFSPEQLRADAEILAGVREFFAILDRVEESDSGREFHPTTIGCCRALEVPKLQAALAKMRKALV